MSGQQLEVGKSQSKIVSFDIYSPQNENVTSQFNIIFKPGTLEVKEKSNTIEVFLYELQKYYDGTELRFGEDDYSIIYIPDGCELYLELNIALTNVGQIKLNMINGMMDEFVYYRVTKNGKDVTSQYNLVFTVYPDTHENYVPLTISPRYIEITAASVEKYYDGNALFSNKYEVTKGALAPNHAMIVTTEGKITDAGKETNKIVDYYIYDIYTFEDVTYNYRVNTISGTLVVHEKNS